jgi:hypothetical protein
MSIYVVKKHEIFWNDENCWIFLNKMGKIVGAGAGAGIFNKLEPEPKLEPELEPHENEPAPQHWQLVTFFQNLSMFSVRLGAGAVEAGAACCGFETLTPYHWFSMIPLSHYDNGIMSWPVLRSRFILMWLRLQPCSIPSQLFKNIQKLTYLRVRAIFSPDFFLIEIM